MSLPELHRHPRQSPQVKTVTDTITPTTRLSRRTFLQTGQLLFTDKKTPGVKYTSPGWGKIIAVNRGKKTKFESAIVDLTGEAAAVFLDNPDKPVGDYSSKEISNTLIEAGLWPTFRTRPYGKVPAIDSTPSALFVTAIDTEPLAPPPERIVDRCSNDYGRGLQLLRRMVEVPIHYCTGHRELLPCEKVDGLSYWTFSGPHPVGLASPHIHCLEPVHEKKRVWHIGYQDIIAIGYLLCTGELMTER